MREINAELNPDAPLRLEIEAFKPGSFDILCALTDAAWAAVTLATVYNPMDALQHASNLITTLADVLSIKAHLAGKKPASTWTTPDGKMTITNTDGQTVVVSAISGNVVLKNSSVNITINNTFSTLQDTSSIEGLTLKRHDGTEAFAVERKDFDRLVAPNIALENLADKVRTITKSRVTLNLFKIVFGNPYKWDFIYDGNRISATIADDTFLSNLMGGRITFGNGDALVCDLEVDQTMNQTHEVYENKRFRVATVYEVVQAPRQPTFDT